MKYRKRLSMSAFIYFDSRFGREDYEIENAPRLDHSLIQKCILFFFNHFQHK